MGGDNRIERQVYRVSEVRFAMGWANSTIHRMIQRGEIATVQTSIGRRISAEEFQRLRGGKPLHIVHEPDPKRQAMAARARRAKAQTAKTAAAEDELATFMQTVIERLDRIEVAVKQGPEGQAIGPRKTPLGSR